jgi:predicted transcriptional regulator
LLELNGVEASSAVLAVIREARVPIARADIVERSGISMQDWASAIRRLLAEGVVVRHGTRRGARYTLVPVTVPDSELFSNA